MIKLTKRICLSLLTLMVAFTLVPTNLFAQADEVTIIDDTDSSIEYSAGDANNGGWGSSGSAADYLNSEHWSNSANATMTFSFTGTQIELYGKNNPTHAKFSVSIDGEEATVHDEYAPVEEKNVLIYKSDELANKEHTITVKVLGEKNPSSTGNLYGFQFTYAKVFSSPVVEETETVVTTIDDATTGTGLNQFEFIGPWFGETGVSGDYEGTEHWSNKGKWGATPPSVTIRFKGNKIEVFGKKENVGATYKAVIDGDEKNATKVDTYDAVVQKQASIYVKEGLDEGEHTLTLTVLKEFNSMGGSYDSVNVGTCIDFAKVTSLEVVSPDKQYETIIDDVDKTDTDEMFKIKYEGLGWEFESGHSKFYKGTDAYSNNADASYSVKFTGNSVELIGSKNQTHADYNVYIDGEKVGEALANLSGGDPQHQQSLFKKTDLEEKEHILRVAIKEESSGAIQTDAIKVTHKAIKPTSIVFDKEALSVEEHMTGTVTANLMPSYSTGSIEYTVGNPELATVSATGEVTGLKAGTTTLSASVKGTKSATIPLTIIPEGAPLVASVGNENFMTTQDDYNAVLSQATTSWDNVAWRGDILNSKIDLAAKKAITNATITASDFKNGDATISASNLEINWLKETMANIGRGDTGAPVKPFQDIIHKGGELDIAAKRVQSAWVNINVPKDAKPGIYTGKITVDADELEEPVVLNYTFEVLDLVQPNPEDMDTQVQIWQHPFSVAEYYGVDKKDYFEEGHLKYIRESMHEYKSLGGKDVVANIVEEAWNHQSYYGDPSMVKWTKKADGTLSFDYDWFDKWIEFNIEEGVIDPEQGIGQIKCYSIVPWENQIAYYDEATQSMKSVKYSTSSQQWRDMWTPFLKDFMAHTKEKGWFDITYIAMDERGLGDLQNAVNLIESVKSSTEETFKISSAFNYQSGNDYSFLDRIDDISIGLSHVNDNSDDMRNMSAHRAELGLLTTIYTCTGDYPGNYTISDPVDNAWCMWYTMTQNTDGYMKWAWDNWVPNILTNVTYKYWEPGDGWFIYPTEKGEESDTYYYKTPRYEMLKQGARDINKAKFLMENSKTLSPKIDKLVKSLERPESAKVYNSATYKNQEERMLTGSEVDRMREGLAGFAREYINPSGVPVTSIEVDKEEVTLEVGKTATITATVLPENATNKTLTWTSSDAKIASVNNGVITAVKAGNAVITVANSDGTVTKEIRVTVKDKEIEIVPVTSIEVDKKDVMLEVGKTATITATVLPENATNKTLTWTSSDAKIASVNNGVITAVKAGNAVITVANSDGTVTKEINVKVLNRPIENIPVTSIEVDKKDVTLEIGKTATITTTVLPENATNKALTWKSSNDKIASVNNGVITAVKAGDAVITVTNSNGSITTEIKVKVLDKAISNVPVTSIVVNKENVTLEVGKIEAISTTVLPANATNKALTWTSSDETVATVKNGVISAIKNGNTVITVTSSDGKVKATIKVTVVGKSTGAGGSTVIPSKDGNVTITGNLPETVEAITSILPKAEQDAISATLTEKNTEFFSLHNVEKIFDITLMDGDKVYTVDGNVVVTLKLDASLLNKKLKVLYIKDDGTFEEMYSSVEDGYIQFITNHFSKYAIVSEEETTTTPDVKNPDTGDSTNMVGWSLLLISAGCVAFVLKKRSKSVKQ